MRYTRREWGKLALTALPAGATLFRTTLDAAGLTAAKPDSRWAGVQVGMNVPYNFGEGNNMPGDEILRRTVALGISAVELRSQPVEMYMGAPFLTPNPPPGERRGRGAGGNGRAAGGGRAAAGGAAGGGRTGGGRAAPTPEQEAAAKAAADARREWRLAAPMPAKVAAFRRMYEDAGVLIQILKWDGIFAFSDAEIDYAFNMAKGLGARAISTEMPIETLDTDTKRLGAFADKHGIMVGYHGHTAVTPEIWERAFALAAHNGANLDLGHFVAGNNTSPIPFLKEHHDRITHIHVKDRKLNNGPNVPFGQGDTPIKEALQLIRDNKWNIQATIEFEYAVPAGSTRMAEMAKCVQYCKNCLLS